MTKGKGTELKKVIEDLLRDFDEAIALLDAGGMCGTADTMRQRVNTHRTAIARARGNEND